MNSKVHAYAAVAREIPMMWFKAKVLIHLWRIGVIRRTTAFRWAMDYSLGERQERR